MKKDKKNILTTASGSPVDPEYGQRVADGLALNLKEVEELAGMSQTDRVKATLQ